MQSLRDALSEALGVAALGALAKIAPAALSDAPIEDEAPVCPTCRGAGYLRRDVQPGEPGFGVPVECSCELGQQRERKRQERIFGETGVPPRYRKYTLDSLEQRYPELARQCREWQGSHRWLVLHGPKGTCKTGAAAVLALEHLAEHGEGSVLFLQPADFLERVRETFGSDDEGPKPREVLERLVNVPLLVLDDVGSEQLTRWGQEQLFRAIDKRDGLHMEGSPRPTIVTTNLALPKLAAHLDPEGRTWDRIKGWAKVVETSGKSHRGQARLPYADDREELPF